MRRVKFKVVSIYFNNERHSVYATGNYDLEYPKGSIVKAREETYGIAVFKTREQAVFFIMARRSKSHLILRVCPIGQGKTIKSVCTNPSEFSLDSFYCMSRTYDVAELPPPRGTIFYPAVEVLD